MPPEERWQLFHFFCGAQRHDDVRDAMTLDSGSSVDLVCNADWLSDMHLRDVPMIIGTNAGALQVDEQGTLNNYGTVPYSGDDMTNVLSLGEMTDRYRVLTFDSAVDNAFHVHLPNRVIRFPRNEEMATG